MDIEDIDVKQLKQIQARFAALSRHRLDKMLNGLSHKKSDFIKLLPLLFHVNHPMLPGYVDKSTPCGIPGYFPSELEKKIAKTVSRSFKFKSRAYLKFEIDALYLMGSTGTLGQSIKSDLDLWVCLSEIPEKKQLMKLEKKVETISVWMAKVGVELNCYIVHKDDFHRKKTKMLTKESCGDTQNFLLLDEFYRTAVWLCGKMPLWWLVPPNENYNEFVDRLMLHRHVDESEWIDFGNVSEIPIKEYFSAALWQLYKAIESPFKSSIKLLMLEIYARDFPKVELLSFQYKSLIYQGVKDKERLDPYLMMLHNAEEFLSEQPERLEFLRRAFYLKVGIKLKLSREKNKNWRYQAILKLAKGWEWKQTRLDYLNNRPHWRVNAVLNERKDLVRELIHSYHFLANFVRQSGELDKASQRELVFLGRKFHAMFERKAGKVELVNNGIARDVGEASITIFQKSNGQWCLFLGALAKTQLLINQAVFKANYFFEVLAWCVCNKVVNRQTNYHIYSDSSSLDHNSVSRTVNSLFKITKDANSELRENQFQSSPEIIKLGVYLCHDNNPRVQQNRQGFYNVINEDDYFCWGESSINLLASFDIFYVNSWGEYGCKHYVGEYSIVQLMLEHYKVLTGKLEKLSFFYANDTENKGVESRLRKLFSDWNKLLTASQKKSQSYRYLISIGRGFLIVDFVKGRILYKYFKQAKRFLHGLGSQSSSNRIFIEKTQLKTEFVIDKNLQLPELQKRVIAKPAIAEDQCHIIQDPNGGYEVLIKLSDGTVFFQYHQQMKLNHLINHYQQLFDSIKRQSAFSGQMTNQCNYWYLKRASVDSEKRESSRFRRVTLSGIKLADLYNRVQAIATTNSENKICYDLYIGEQGFQYVDFGELVYKKVVQYILEYRNNNSRYPIFVSDLDLSAISQDAPVVEYLEHKRLIEQRLNRALKQLKPVK